MVDRREPTAPETTSSASAASGSKEARLAEVQKKIDDLVKEREKIMQEEEGK